MGDFTMFVLLTGIVVGSMSVALYLWVRAELDERRWRRRLNEAMGKHAQQSNVRRLP